MLTGVIVTSDATTASLTLSLQDSANGYIVKDITGLDPVKSNIASSPFAGLDGAQFQSNKRDVRNVVLTLGIEPYSGGSTVQALRQALYPFFMPKTNVHMVFVLDGTPFAYVDGQVESFETPLFAKDPEIAISVLCFDPDLKGISTVMYAASTSPNTTDFTIDYAGSVETGFLFEMTANRAMTGFDLYLRRPNNTQTVLNLAASILTNDVIQLSSHPRSKYAKLIRGGVETSLLYAVAPTSKWPSLLPGENYLRVYSPGAPVPLSVTYPNLYGGL